MPVLKNVEVYLTVDGIQLEEHSVITNCDSHTIHRVIHSEAEKNFVVHFKDRRKRPHVAIRGAVWVNGSEAANRVCDPAERDNVHQTLEGIPTSESTVSPFRFIQLERTGDWGIVETDDDVLKCLGTVIVVIERGHTVGASEMNYEAYDIDEPVIHENSEAPSDHCVGFGSPINIGPVDTVKWQPHAGTPKTYFLFHYGSEALMTETVAVDTAVDRSSEGLVSAYEVSEHPRTRPHDREREGSATSSPTQGIHQLNRPRQTTTPATGSASLGHRGEIPVQKIAGGSDQKRNRDHADEGVDDDDRSDIIAHIDKIDRDIRDLQKCKTNSGPGADQAINNRLDERIANARTQRMALQTLMTDLRRNSSSTHLQVAHRAKRLRMSTGTSIGSSAGSEEL